jgi:hypothetical protein
MKLTTYILYDPAILLLVISREKNMCTEKLDKIFIETIFANSPKLEINLGSISRRIDD